MSDEIKEDPFADLAPIAKDFDMPPTVGIAAVALNLALKYHDIATIKDGVMYQHQKMEGKNLSPIHFDMVLETARQIEAHLMTSEERIFKIIETAWPDLLEAKDDD